MQGGLGVKLKANVGGNLDVAGTSKLATVNIDAGAIDGTTIGANSAAAGTFTTITGTTVTSTATTDSSTSTTGAMTLAGGLGVKLKANVGGDLDVAGTSTLATVDINAGAIDGTTIGANSAAAGTFAAIAGTALTSTSTADSSSSTTGAMTTAGGLGVKLKANVGVDVAVAGTATLATVDINAGNIDGTTIGAATPAAATATTLTSTATTDSSSSLIGAVKTAGGLGVKL